MVIWLAGLTQEIQARFGICHYQGAVYWFQDQERQPISLLPGESLTEIATFNASTLPAGSKVQVNGFNITLK